MQYRKNNGLNTSGKVYQFVCVLFSLLDLRVGLGFDCISSRSMLSRKVYQFICVLQSLLVVTVGLGFDCISSWSTPIFFLLLLEFFFKRIRKLMDLYIA